ncbi:MAG: M23 family metallopeptidase [Bacteroidales bacterium]|jgi:murein DD-endopeptidase MepM/ murein hydrolase activator NlpD|nr:M23 family metallopeptidase [Bacteroidales bacterium]NPV36764.1 M23 family metallopeptidase [Bacteroidales bacterium]
MSKKHRYYFDPITLTYQLIPVRFRDKLKRVLYILAAGLVFSTIVITLAYRFFSSPKERMLLREIDLYKTQLQALNQELERMNKVLDNLQQRDNNIYRVVFEIEPIPASAREGALGGADRYTSLRNMTTGDLLLETAMKLDKIKSRMYVQSKSYDEVFKLAKQKEAMLTAIPAIQPINKRDLKYISSYFGYRLHPIYKTVMFHAGLDFTAPVGAKVFATGDGVVEEASQVIKDGYGRKVIINHGFGYKTVYAHLQSFRVRPGQKVKRGDWIANVGNTGLSSGPHLHYEVVYNNKPVNPAYFMFDIDPATFQDMINQSPYFTETPKAPVAE